MTGEQAAKAAVRMSVRAVVETTLHESDLVPASGVARRMREGAAAHRARQGGQRGGEENYRVEVALSAEYETPALTLRVTGRADGVLTRADGLTVIEEIKLGAADSPLVPAHRAQAAMYGHMLCAQEGMPRAGLRVLYVDGGGNPLRAYEEECDAQTLAREFSALCAAAAAWEEKKLARRRARDASLETLSFPYPAYRAGQRRFAGNVYVALTQRKRLFAQAPTGIGKTMAALFPALLALREGHCQRVLFLTARTTGRKSAMDAMATLRRGGARAMAVELTAMDKICPRPARDCRPEVCPLARGFFDRLPGALDEALSGGETLGAEAVSALAARHAICPFEMELALAGIADVVVCDYNYVFDPVVAVDALLPGAALLVDEAHQLPPRVRDAMSASAGVDDLTEIRREAGKAHGRACALYRALTGAIRALKECAALPEFAQGALCAPPPALSAAMEQVLEAASAQLAQAASPCALDAFSLAAGFGFACGKFDARYAALASGGEKHARVSLVCLDASPEILASTKRARGTAFFSATLAPFDAARRMLGSEEGDACLALPSPFDPGQLTARIEPVDIRYAAREQTAPRVAQLIGAHLRENEGNALVFFPSYAYMGRILAELGEGAGVRVLREERGMGEEERRALLAAFDGGERVALFAVLGGSFSEGIDLPGERLKNVVVVSTGLPQPDEKVKAMQAYYDGCGEDGFWLCMTLPGMVRVIQAAGRLIRTDEDTGTLLLIDSRFCRRRERALLAGTLIGDALTINGQ